MISKTAVRPVGNDRGLGLERLADVHAVCFRDYVYLAENATPVVIVVVHDNM